MVALYDATILLSIGLASVLGAVFAIAVTFLGRSLEQARTDEAEAERQAKTESEARINKAKQTLENPSTEEALPELQKQLKEAKKADNKRRRQKLWRRFTTGPHLLGVIE
ncbi:MAG: hypothetical protein V3S37_03540, partial [Dehalococcoidia bacterium]